MAADTSANIGIRVFLDDAASRGLYAMNTQLGQMGSLANRAGLGFGAMSASMAGLAVVTGVVATFLAFGGAILYSTTQAAAFETLMVRIQRATNATSGEMVQMQQVMMSLGGSSIFSLDQIAAGFVLLGQRGITAQQIMDGVGQAGVMLAEAIGSTPVEAMGLLASTLAAFNIPAKDAMQTADLLQFAYENGVPSVSQLTSALAKLGSIASVLKIPLDQIVPALDILGHAMGNGSSAATSLYYFLKQVAAGTTPFRDEIAKLGLSFYDVHGKFIGLNQSLDVLYTKLKDKSPEDAANILSKLFNIKSSQGISILLQDLSRLHDLSQKLAGSHDNLGMVIKRAQQAVDTAQGSWSALKTNLQDIAIIVGGPFLKAIEPFLKNLLQITQTVRMWAAENPQATTTILSLGAAITGIGLIVMAALTPIGQFVLIVLAVMAVITAVTVGIVWLKSNWAQLTSATGALHPIIAAITPILSALGGYFQSVGNDIARQLAPAWKQFMTEVQPALPAFKQFGDFLKTFVLPLLGMLALFLIGTVVTALRITIGFLISFFAGLGPVVGGIANILAGIGNVFQGWFHVLHGIFTLNGNEILSGFLQIWRGMTQQLQGIGAALLGIVRAIIQGFVGAWVGLVNSIINFSKQLWEKLVGHSIFPDIMHGILSVITSAIPNIIRAVISMVTQFIGNVATLPGRISSAIGNAATILYTKGQQIIQGLSNGVGSFFGNIGSKIGELPGKVKSAIGNAASWLYDSGQQIIQGLINGLQSMLGNLLNAAGGMLNSLRDMFPHSPAKAGPLRDAHTWMPNLMKILTETTDASGASVQASMSRVAGRVQTGFFSPTGGAGGAGGAGGGETYTLNVDGKAFMSFFHNKITGDLQANGVGRLLR